MIHPYSHYPARTARRWPDRVALVDGARRRTYRELDERASQLARVLIRQGLSPGDRVSVVQENRIEYVEIVIAIARAGGVIVPLLGVLTEREHAFMVEDADVCFVVALTKSSIPRARAAAEKSEAAVMTLEAGEGAVDLAALAVHESSQAPGIDRSPDSLAQILYTSGTTGHPKGGRGPQYFRLARKIASSDSLPSAISAVAVWIVVGSRARRSSSNPQLIRRPCSVRSPNTGSR